MTANVPTGGDLLAARGTSAGTFAATTLTLAALTGAMMLAFLDRQLLNLLVDPIRQNVHISDTQFSLLQGASFSALYSIVLLPIALLSDRYNRKTIIILSIAGWSVMTVCFGLATSFVALLVARAGLAIGEAGLSPAAISILRDAYPKHRQATAISILTLGVYLGGGFSFMVGGPALSWLREIEVTQGLPGGLAPWRWLFIGAGGLGLLGMLLLALVREPARGTVPSGSTIGWSEYFAQLRSCRAEAVAYLCAFIGLMAMATALSAWLPTLFMRSHHWSPRAVGLSFGAINLIAGVLGAVGSGWATDRLIARGKNLGQISVVQLGGLAMGLGGITAALAVDPYVGLAATALATMGTGMCVGLGSMGFQAMFPAPFSARAVATYLLVTGLLGASLGPTIPPLVARWLEAGEHIGPAFALSAGVFLLWVMGWLLWLRRVASAAGRSARTI
ncbi:MAG: MFS transporter [Janthinobacterium lividum]